MRLRKWAQEAKAILSSEINRLSGLVDDRNKTYHAEMLPLLEDLENNRLTLTKVLDSLDKEKNKQDRENEELFESYISTLKNLQSQ